MIAADTLFIQLEDGRPVPDSALNIVTRALSAIPEVELASIMTPARISSSPPGIRFPALVIEIDFRNPSALDAFLTKSSARDDFLRCISIASNLAEDGISYQAMSRRSALSPAPQFWSRAAQLCTYLVEYLGEADDLEAWLDHFDHVHVPILARLPDIRAATSFRPAMFTSKPLPWRTGHAMQRNKIVFDDVGALDAALASPVIADIRADAAKFPPYSLAPTRTAMQTRTVG